MTRTNHLNLMIDYDLVDREIIAALKQLNALKIKTIIEHGFNQDTKDKVLVGSTKKKKSLLLTGDKSTITKERYKPCTHGGIIIIKDPRPSPEKVYAWVKAFIQSGQRAFAKNHVTHLRKDGFTIFTHNPEPIRGTY